MAGKTIKLFFVDGDPSGLRVADVMNWAGIALAVPRNHLPQFKSRKEAVRPGVYILLGDDPDAVGEVRGYIGETEALGLRLAQHARDSSKEWWTEAVVFTSKDGNLTKAHAKHLELALHTLASEAARVNLTNGAAPSGAALPESDLADMEGFLEYVRLTLPPLSGRAGQMLEPRSGTRTSGPEFTYLVLKAQARMRRSSEGYVVLRGSTAVRKTYDSISKGYRALREGLIRDGTLVPHESAELLLFRTDAVFTSSSAAAVVVAGSPQSGPAGWRLPDGTSLGAVEAAELE
ncbi:GIY-YIG nuclease family protein [Myxococcus sp. CA051A]|uniref:GIY-YIG nuclease family protein n=1 Tax=unclassified Myxococcus TaxID=2648731 RepID=UPI00157B12C8|nr:GIY-YIG nuclease family protein [Myxococcus sp. CA033]NTX59320.1 GIY-YIG nuclease family protein [Myxococcus sp. CA051A]